ncbi:hypothetical protein B0J13DRAFT_211666 [Dactylonectria estremocensis]|uniref:VOC domain-containing protein n=1 Tax=Dactylonectria estremocensis TaxID=1079267 RepID=A0A9P9F7A0_9HYPO|nr:hypothetical protein B0J13DRAFT_211666 [Dactylonectria estremocensis]
MWALSSQVTASSRLSPIDTRTPSPVPGLLHGPSPTHSEFGQRTPLPIPSDSVHPEMFDSEAEFDGGFAELHHQSINAMDVMPVTMSWLPDGKQAHEVTASALNRQAVAKLPDMGSSEFIMISCFNIQRAELFYSRCFGWTFLGDINKPDSSDEAMRRHGSSPYDAQSMSFFTRDSSNDSHNIAGALLQRNNASASWIEVQAQAMQVRAGAACHLRVPDIGDAADRIEANLGVVKSLRFGIRGMMDIGEFMDPEGNLFGLVAYHPQNVGV